jgi:hypothetical protein
MIIYEDFSIKIEPKRGDYYPVIVLKSPAGEGRSTFELPFDPADLGQLLVDLGDSVRSANPNLQRSSEEKSPQTVGDQLFNALFSGPIRSLLDRSMGMIHGQEKGLRIKIHIDPQDPSLAPLSSLPWEFIYRKDTRDFLNLSRYTPVLRYLDVQRPYSPLPLEPPLRILVVMSEPQGYVGLNLESERKLIEGTWAQHQDVQVDFVENATIATLQDRLAEEKWHVLHYMGHGGFDEASGQGVLVLEDDRQGAKLIDGSTLGILLRDAHSLRLVFLNACETARSGKQQGIDPFAGVASALVLTGVPAVVAMQFPITDESAIQFTQRFYPLLARGYPVDAAAAEGRRAIRLTNANSLEWGTPVLFMRAPDGEIFKVSERRAAELAEDQDQSVEELELLYRSGMEAFWRDDWDAAAEEFQAVARLRPGYRDVQRRLTEAQRQQRLSQLDGEAQAAEARQDWQAAAAALAALMAAAPDYKDARRRQERVESAMAGSRATSPIDGTAAIGTPRQATVEPIPPAASATGPKAASAAPAGRSRKFPLWTLALLLLVAIVSVVTFSLNRPDEGGTIPPGTGDQAMITPIGPVDTVTATPTERSEATNTATATITRPTIVTPVFPLKTSLPGIAPQGVVPAVISPAVISPDDQSPTPITQTPALALQPLIVTPNLLLATPVLTLDAQTPTPTLPPADTSTPTPIATPTPAQPIEPLLTAAGDTNLRAGPGTEFAVVGLLQEGESLPITGRNAAGTWWQITTTQGSQGWIIANRVRATGPLDQVAVVAAPTVAPTATSAATPAVTPALPDVLEDFESVGAWQRGDQPYGSLQSSSENVRSGVRSGKLSYDFPATSDNYVVFSARPALAMSGRPTGITAWVFGNASGHFLNAWVLGSDGEVRAYTFGQINHTGWQQMTAWLNDVRSWPNGHISGLDNGKLDFPARLYALVLDGVPDGVASRGAIFLDDIGVTAGAAP